MDDAQTRPEYKDLESRVDALRDAHVSMLKSVDDKPVYTFYLNVPHHFRVTSAYNTAYDYPVNLGETFATFGTTVSTSFSSLTAAAGATAPAADKPTPVAPPPKTLPHALSRAALGSAALSADPNDPLGQALKLYGEALDKEGSARLVQDASIKSGFLVPWQQTLTTSVQAALKARAAVRGSRLELDGAKASLKSASTAKQEQARLLVENAEDDLVQKTEVAITLMKAVLDNVRLFVSLPMPTALLMNAVQPEPIKNLNELIKAQLTYHAAAADALASAQGSIEDLSVHADGAYR